MSLSDLINNAVPGSRLSSLQAQSLFVLLSAHCQSATKLALQDCLFRDLTEWACYSRYTRIKFSDNDIAFYTASMDPGREISNIRKLILKN